MFALAVWIVSIQIQQAAPTAANADYLVAFIDGPVDNGFNRRIQPRDITATCQYTDFHYITPFSLGFTTEVMPIFRRRVSEKMQTLSLDDTDLCIKFQGCVVDGTHKSNMVFFGHFAQFVETWLWSDNGRIPDLALSIPHLCLIVIFILLKLKGCGLGCI
jgi:hypothetical protein